MLLQHRSNPKNAINVSAVTCRYPSHHCKTMNPIQPFDSSSSSSTAEAEKTSNARVTAAPVPDPQPRLAQGYAGDISPVLAWQWAQQGKAQLIDIRTQAERDWVGFVPGAPFVPWKLWPGMAINASFDNQLKATAPPGACVLLLCRSGIRSIAAAQRATELGFEAYNILEGFEGDPDAQAHRGFKGGWRFRGLPWRQG